MGIGSGFACVIRGTQAKWDDASTCDTAGRYFRHDLGLYPSCVLEAPIWQGGDEGPIDGLLNLRLKLATQTNIELEDLKILDR